MLASVAGATPAAAQPFKAVPVDEAGEDPALAALRDRLLAAVRRRDVDGVVALAAPDIHLSFGGHHGRQTLRRWLDGVDDLPWTGGYYWQQLQDALALGGAWQDTGAGRHFCAPYTFVAAYPQDIDPFHVVFIIGTDVALHSGPDADDPVVGRLSYDIAAIIDSVPGEPAGDPAAPYWLRIRTADGAADGYVRSTDVRSPVDYRACFHRDGETGDWVWDTFIGGD